jgi:hypothetical protein
MDDMRQDIVRLQTIIELGFKRIDEKLDDAKSQTIEECARINERVNKHENLIDKITKRLDSLSWKVVGWVMAGVSIPIILGLVVTKLF